MSEMVERVARAMAARCRRSHDWPFWMDEARAAIEAMREPTLQMQIAGESGEYGSEENDRCAARQTWQAMIDAALSEGEG